MPNPLVLIIMIRAPTYYTYKSCSSVRVFKNNNYYMKKTLKEFLIYILVAICSAVVTFFSSCTTMWFKGHDINPVIDVSPKVSSDSTSFFRFSFVKPSNNV